MSWFVSLEYNFEGLLLHKIGENIIWDISCRPWIRVCQPVESHHQDLSQRRKEEAGGGGPCVAVVTVWCNGERGSYLSCYNNQRPRPRKSPQRYFPLSPTQPTPATTALSIYVVSQKNQHIIFPSRWNLWSDLKHRVLHPIWMYGSESSWIQTKSGVKSPFGKLHFITCTPLCYRKSPKKSIRYHRSKNKNLPYILILSTCYTFLPQQNQLKWTCPQNWSPFLEGSILLMKY